MFCGVIPNSKFISFGDLIRTYGWMSYPQNWCNTNRNSGYLSFCPTLGANIYWTTQKRTAVPVNQSLYVNLIRRFRKRKLKFITQSPNKTLTAYSVRARNELFQLSPGGVLRPPKLLTSTGRVDVSKTSKWLTTVKWYAGTTMDGELVTAKRAVATQLQELTEVRKDGVLDES